MRRDGRQILCGGGNACALSGRARHAHPAPAVDKPSELTLLRLTEDDWAVWRDVRLRALTDAPDVFGSSLADWSGLGDREERWRSRLVDVPLNVVATAGDSLIGQVSGTSSTSAPSAELISMWVDPAGQGTGVGEALIGEVIVWARACGAAAVTLSVKTTNSHAASLYRRMGLLADRRARRRG